MVLHGNYALFDLHPLFQQFSKESFVRIPGDNFAISIVSLVIQRHVSCIAMKHADNLSFDIHFTKLVSQEVHVADTHGHVTSKCQMIHVKYDICLFQHHWNLDYNVLLTLLVFVVYNGISLYIRNTKLLLPNVPVQRWAA